MNSTSQPDSETDDSIWDSETDDSIWDSETDDNIWGSSGDEEFATTNSTHSNYVTKNSVQQGASMAVFYANFSEHLNHTVNDGGESGNNETIHKLPLVYNVFLDYPTELLCFGAICFILFAVVGIIGNFVSILALSKCKRLRNATTAFIVNLCAADLLFCSFSMPLSAITFIEKNWPYGELLCQLFPLVRYSNGAVSLFSVISITVNRYILIVHPKKYPIVYTKRNMAIMISFIWLTSVLLLLPPLLGIWGTLGYDSAVGTCTILKKNGLSPKMPIYIAGFGLTSIIFLFCYLRIYLVVRKSSKKSQRKEDNFSNLSFTSRSGFFSRSYRHSEMDDAYVQHRTKHELRVLRVMLVIFVVFILSYFPISFVKVFHKEDKLHIMNVIGYLGVYFSNIVNPLVYIVMSTEYRMAYKELFCKNSVKN